MAMGLYIHIPFCPQQCPYCVFSVVTGQRRFHQRYMEAVCTEIEMRQSEYANHFTTVFFGGGTPSHVPVHCLSQILEMADKSCGVRWDGEISVEANPGANDVLKYGQLREAGFNRISIGVQSFCDTSLKQLGRIHSGEDAIAAFTAARMAGFDNINLDVIFSIPGVPRSDLYHTLDTVERLSPEHVSAYSLTVEEGSTLESHVMSGRIVPNNEDEDAAQYFEVIERLRAIGYEQYEVSNFAKPGYRCQHNWSHWCHGDFVGIGLSAHSYLRGIRSWNEKKLQEYINRLERGQSVRIGEERIDSSTKSLERLLLRLRTKDGIPLTKSEWAKLREELNDDDMIKAGFIELTESHLRLTSQGMPMADAISVAMIDTFKRSVSVSK